MILKEPSTNVLLENCRKRVARPPTRNYATVKVHPGRHFFLNTSKLSFLTTRRMRRAA
jgi:hypothetical protein